MMANAIIGVDPKNRPGTAYTPKAGGVVMGASWNLDTTPDAGQVWLDLRAYTRVAITLDFHAATGVSLDIQHSVDGVNSVANLVSGAAASTTLFYAGPLSFVRPKLNALASGVVGIDVKAAP